MIHMACSAVKHTVKVYPLNGPHALMWKHIKNILSISIYIFWQQENLLHFQDMLHNLCLISIICCLFHIFILFFVNIILLHFFVYYALKFKYQPGHLKVESVNFTFYIHYNYRHDSQESLKYRKYVTKIKVQNHKHTHILKTLFL